MPFVQNQKIVEIAGDGAHGHVARGDFKSGKPGYFTGQDGGLNLIGDLKLLINRQQPLVLRESTVGGNIAQAANENQKSDWLNVPLVGKHPEILEIGRNGK